MMYVAENLRHLRKNKDLTQEEAAEMLGVSPQSVSKWERGDTLPDITLLPALANLYQTSVDAIIGMDKINDSRTMDAIFTAGQRHMQDGEFDTAIAVYAEALKTFPSHLGLMSELAMALALAGGQARLTQAIALCERVLSGGQGEKVHHTTRAALCFLYLKNGEKERALALARKLPHERESREVILAELAKELTAEEIDAHIRHIA